MILEILNDLVTQLAAALGVTVVKGFPDWARPALAPPLAALEITGWLPSTNRIGQRQARQTASFRFWVFARQEPELCTLLDSLTTWSAATNAANINSRIVDLALSDGQRHTPETPAQQEQHAFLFTLTASWSG